MTLVLEASFDRSQLETYAHLPFEVPPGAKRLDVRLEYGHRISAVPEARGGNTLDLGLFDPRGIEFLDAGFRGWSGSERDAIFVSETDATPGYLAGPIQPGRWHVLLGLYKLAPEGVTARVTITMSETRFLEETGSLGETASPAETASLSGPLPSSPVLSPFGPWMRGEMHSHTVQSDGDLTPKELIALARSRGLQFLAITDHNTTSHQRALAALADPGLILIRGMEVTTYRGHFNVWGIPDWIDFRVERPEQMQSALRRARDRGGLAVCNHPKPTGPSWDYPAVDTYDAIEVWNGPWAIRNEISLGFWLNQLARGRRVPAVGGSDFHHPGEMSPSSLRRSPGIPTNWVHIAGEATANSILREFRAGHVSLSASPEGPLLELRAGPGFEAMGGDALKRPEDGALEIEMRVRGGAGGRLILLDQRGMRFEQDVERDEERIMQKLPAEDSAYLRAEVRGKDGAMWALTNPVYF